MPDHGKDVLELEAAPLTRGHHTATLALGTDQYVLLAIIEDGEQVWLSPVP